jgi:hypothetical protein
MRPESSSLAMSAVKAYKVLNSLSHGVLNVKSVYPRPLKVDFFTESCEILKNFSFSLKHPSFELFKTKLFATFKEPFATYGEWRMG